MKKMLWHWFNTAMVLASLLEGLSYAVNKLRLQHKLLLDRVRSSMPTRRFSIDFVRWLENSATELSAFVDPLNMKYDPTNIRFGTHKEVAGAKMFGGDLSMEDGDSMLPVIELSRSQFDIIECRPQVS